MPHFKWIAMSLVVAAIGLCVRPATAFDPRTDHKCVANCGGGRTIIIEREVQPRPGPPVIIWKLPSAEGATQSDFTTITDPALRAELAKNTMTPYMLLGKGRRALRDGDCQRGLGYLQAARDGNPSASESSEIEAAWGKAKFDCAGTTGLKFQKTPDRGIAIQIEGVSDKVFDQLFNPDRKDLEPLRQKLLPLFVEQSKARFKVEELQSKHIKGEELERAETALRTAREAVTKNVEQAKQEYRLE